LHLEHLPVVVERDLVLERVRQRDLDRGADRDLLEEDLGNLNLGGAAPEDDVDRLGVDRRTERLDVLAERAAGEVELVACISKRTTR
jgi:hypothetical protein